MATSPCGSKTLHVTALSSGTCFGVMTFILKKLIRSKWKTCIIIRWKLTWSITNNTLAKTPHYVVYFLILASSISKLLIATYLLFWKYKGHDPKISTTTDSSNMVNLYRIICTASVSFFFFLFFLKFICRTHSHVLFWGHCTPVLDFWWRLHWVSKPEWVLPYSHCGGKCNVHFLRSTSGATHCWPLDGQHCGASTGFISCPRILLCGSSEFRTCDQQIMSAAR